MAERMTPLKRLKASAKTVPSPEPNNAFSESTQRAGVTGSTTSNEEIARTAYSLWEQRGKPFGSPEEDWYKAKEQLCVSF